MTRMRRPMLGLAATLACILLAAATAPAADWEKLSDQDGLLLERRAIPGSHHYEIRATGRSSLPPATLFETIWNQREYREFVPYLKRLDFISETAEERVVYEQVSVPLARDRDYTVRVRRRVDLGAQRYQILFRSADEAGPPPDPHHVRVRDIRGSWTIEPASDGRGSLIRYDVQSEPGGFVPALVANRAQRDAAPRLVRAMIQRAVEKSRRK